MWIFQAISVLKLVNPRGKRIDPFQKSCFFQYVRDDTRCWIHHWKKHHFGRSFAATVQVVHEQTHHKYMETVRVYYIYILCLRSIIYVYLLHNFSFHWHSILVSQSHPLSSPCSPRSACFCGTPCMASRRTQNPALLPELNCNCFIVFPWASSTPTCNIIIPTSQHILFQRHQILSQHMGVSKNSGTPKWMVYNGKPY